MAHSLSYSTSILDTFSILASFSPAGVIWDKYEKYAIPKIEDATLKIRGSLFYLKDLTPKQAEKELKSLDKIILVLNKYKDMLYSIDDKEYIHFKNVTIEFFNTIDLLHNNLMDITNVHASYELSINTLSKDWDSEEDQHWDNY
ncbi:MAG: hypothetical protein KC414_14585 [Romboutsia sp.]|nr:hypothetical protein [Romboutsia sp.]MCB9225931.1 hypothetical protein [Chitinophagales bacterium]